MERGALTLTGNSSGIWRYELGFEGGPGGFGKNSRSGDRDQSEGDASAFELEHTETRQSPLRGLQRSTVNLKDTIMLYLS
jgi:hypothetical protein